jgi:glycosyltransferase involved in cell wall biosynthesis
MAMRREPSVAHVGLHPTPVDVPLVSCLMPTSGRPELAARAARCFLMQDHPRRELVVVGEDSAELREALPRDDRIRLVEVAAKRSIGELRNIACRHARGDVVAHWDDDDWHGPQRLSRQIAPLVAGTADVTALRDVLFLDVATGQFWRCTPQLHRRIFRRDVHGGTLVYFKAIWDRGVRYPDTSLAEDAAFLDLAILSGARLRAVPAEELFVYVRHIGNAWNFRCGQFVDRNGWRQAVGPAWSAATRLSYASGAGVIQDTPAELPLVSCIMPTRDRRRFALRAIGYFARQRYPHRELVIVDDGEDPIADLAPVDEAVRYLRLPRRTVLGVKRNLACEAARGSVIVHWDDDDWYHERRLDLQVGELLARRADLCGAASLFFLDPMAGSAWRFRYRGRGRPWFAGTSLCYRREVWSDQPFQELAVGEDNHFVLGAGGRPVVDVGDADCVVGIVHDSNTSLKRVRDAQWTGVSVQAVEQVLGDDARFYHPPRTDKTELLRISPGSRDRTRHRR